MVTDEKEKSKPGFVRAMEKDQERINKSVKRYHLTDLLVDPTKVLSVVVPYGDGEFEVKYKTLTYEDFNTIQEWKVTDNKEMALRLLSLAISKVDDAWTLERAKLLPFDVPQKIISAIGLSLGMDFTGLPTK